MTYRPKPVGNFAGELSKFDLIDVQ